MDWIDRLERKIGNLCIRNLMALIVLLQGVLWVLIMFVNYNLYNLLSLSLPQILRGQLWRLITFLFLPDLQFSLLHIALELYFYYMIGTALERYWGSFRFNVFVLLGMLGAIAGCFLTGFGTAYGIWMSLFFAYAWENPNQEFLLFFLVPVKARWLGLIAAGFWALSFFTTTLAGKVSLVLGLLGFLVFYGRDLFAWIRDSVVNRRRRNRWNNDWRNRRY